MTDPTPSTDHVLDPLQLLTVPEAADVLGVGVQRVYRLTAERRLEHIKIGTGKTGAVRITRAQLAAFIAANTVTARP